MAVKTGQKTFNMNLKVSGDNVEKVEALIADHAVFMRENHSLDDAKIQLEHYVVINLETHLRQIREQPLHGNPPL